MCGTKLVSGKFLMGEYGRLPTLINGLDTRTEFPRVHMKMYTSFNKPSLYLD